VAVYQLKEGVFRKEGEDLHSRIIRAISGLSRRVTQMSARSYAERSIGKPPMSQIAQMIALKFVAYWILRPGICDYSCHEWLVSQISAEKYAELRREKPPISRIAQMIALNLWCIILRPAFVIIHTLVACLTEQRR
jgi:hypothetical protein